jgi:hypothetical protein
LQVSEGLSYILGKVGHKIDPSALLYHQKGLLVDELGVEGKVLQKVLEVGQDFHFQLK